MQLIDHIVQGWLIGAATSSPKNNPERRKGNWFESNKNIKIKQEQGLYTQDRIAAIYNQDGKLPRL